MNKSAQLKKELRYQQWLAEVQEYNSRPEGMTVREWCFLKGIKAPTFYDYLHKIQEYYMDELQQTNSQELIKRKRLVFHRFPVIELIFRNAIRQTPLSNIE